MVLRGVGSYKCRTSKVFIMTLDFLLRVAEAPGELEVNDQI